MKLKITAFVFGLLATPALAQQAPSPAVVQKVTQAIQSRIGELEIANTQLQAELQETLAKLKEIQDAKQDTKASPNNGSGSP